MKLTKRQIQRLSNILLGRVIERYGLSKYYTETPYLLLDDSPYADAKDPNAKGAFIFEDNELVVYWQNIENEEELARTIVHEYQHCLQSPRWFTRYYTMGYTYDTHPYEVQAYSEEENWKEVLMVA